MLKKITLTITSVIFWIFLWYVLSCKINSEIFLPSPRATFKALIHLSGKSDFWKIILSTFSRIVCGFLCAVVIGVVGALTAYFVQVVDIILSPLMKLIKAVPVVSFIILALLWVDSEKLPVLISFGMVLPVIYINVLQGCRSVNIDMVEMSRVFGMNGGMKLRFIYLPCILPSFISACKIGLGFCFKAGIAAEVIGLPVRSIGSELYKSKLYLMTDELFAWTVVIVLLSAFFERICIYILNRMGKLAGKVNIVREVKSQVSYDKYEVKNNSDYTSDDIIDADSKNTDNVREGSKLLISQLYKSYRSKKVLNNVNFQLNNSSINCISGESGIGKTTLLKIIAGIIKSDKGSVRLIPDEDNNSNYRSNNYRISDYRSSDCENSNYGFSKYKVSMVFQENRLIEESDVYTNLYCVMGKNYSKEEADRHLDMVGLSGMGNVKVRELSGGMKRRVAIIRAMIKESDIILLDEPFKGLDDRLKLRVMDYVKEYVHERIVLMVSHDIRECENMGGRLFNLKDINGGG